MILGIDPSTYFEVQAKDPHFFYQGKEVEPLSLLHDHNGCAVMRIRLWIDPYDENGKPYHGGTNDWPAFLKLAKLGMSKGYTIMLDFHYSDFWCDPSKQTMPKSWQGLSVKEVAGKVYAYTRKSFRHLLYSDRERDYEWYALAFRLSRWEPYGRSPTWLRQSLRLPFRGGESLSGSDAPSQDHHPS
jgi:arabinogalactan endo-1,4-beta-galactosidase